MKKHSQAFTQALAKHKVLDDQMLAQKCPKYDGKIKSVQKI